MTNYLNSPTQMWLDFEADLQETIDLSKESINQAIEFSAKIPNEQQQWQTYLNVLALAAFEEWLSSRGTDLMVNREHCTILQPAIANVIDAVCNLQVNEFKICLITSGSFTDQEVTLPQAVIDLPEFIPHFYVLIEVREERETAVIHSFLSYQQLVNQRATVNLEPDQDWTYQLPLSWFEAEPDRLLLFLRCLEPSVMALPALGSNQLKSSQLSQLPSLLPQLDSSRQLWQVLSWEQGAVLLTNSDLLNWVYKFQRGETNSPQHQSDVLQLLTQPALNAGRWLLNQLDTLAEELSWVLLPSLALAAPIQELRSPVKEFEAIAKQLRHNGVEIPTTARGAYRDLQLAGRPLRLYGVTWSMLSDSVPEWTLLLVLGAVQNTGLPSGLRLRVSDQSSVLVEQILDNQTRESYLFTSVIGSWDEKFIVTVGLNSGIEQTLPPFSFAP